MEDVAVDLWATDEVHFQQHGSRCRMWVPPETKDPVLLHHPTRRSVGYFGAVRLRDGKFQFSRETGKFNAMTFFAFLKGLRRTSIGGDYEDETSLVAHVPLLAITKRSKLRIVSTSCSGSPVRLPAQFFSAGHNQGGRK
jgi:hypothetical protein